MFHSSFASLALKGLVIGLSLSAPIGPVGVLCIRRSLTMGRNYGWMTGLGAATADVIWGGAAGFGMNAITELLHGVRPLLGFLGGLGVCLLGVGIWIRAKVVAVAPAATGSSFLAGYLSALFVTLVNPLTSLSIVAIFSGLGIGVATNRTETAVFLAGIATGAALWWYLLSQAVSLFSAKISGSLLAAINHVSALAILVLGALLMVAALR